MSCPAEVVIVGKWSASTGSNFSDEFSLPGTG
jgi:hypothetical protein